ncbi:hypothetical protein LQW54_004736 [Pestalotiopsis sp. IQ-011]
MNLEGESHFKFEQKPWKPSINENVVQLFEVGQFRQDRAHVFMMSIMWHGPRVLATHLDDEDYDCVMWSRKMLTHLASDHHVQLPEDMDDFMKVFAAQARRLRELKLDMQKENRKFTPKVLTYKP